MRLLNECPPCYNNEEIFKLHLVSNSVGVISSERIQRTVQHELIIDDSSEYELKIYDILDQSKTTVRQVKGKITQNKTINLFEWVKEALPLLEQEDYFSRYHRGASFDITDGWLLEVYTHTPEFKDKIFVYRGSPSTEKQSEKIDCYRTISESLRETTGIPYLFAFDGGMIDLAGGFRVKMPQSVEELKQILAKFWRFILISMHLNIASMDFDEILPELTAHALTQIYGLIGKCVSKSDYLPDVSEEYIYGICPYSFASDVLKTDTSLQIESVALAKNIRRPLNPYLEAHAAFVLDAELPCNVHEKSPDERIALYDLATYKMIEEMNHSQVNPLVEKWSLKFYGKLRTIDEWLYKDKKLTNAEIASVVDEYNDLYEDAKQTEEPQEYIAKAINLYRLESRTRLDMILHIAKECNIDQINARTERGGYIWGNIDLRRHGVRIDSGLYYTRDLNQTIMRVYYLDDEAYNEWVNQYLTQRIAISSAVAILNNMLTACYKANGIPMFLFRADDICSFFKEEYKFIDEHEPIQLKRYNHKELRVHGDAVKAVKTLMEMLYNKKYLTKETTENEKQTT